jgi:hypothetical protein
VAVKLYLDEDVDPLLASVLRERGVDCLSTREAVNLGHSDAEQLIFATDQSRAILTFNVKDFVTLSRLTVTNGHHHSGIIVPDHLPFRDLLRRTLVLLQRYSTSDLTDTLLWLQDYKDTKVT